MLLSVVAWTLEYYAERVEKEILELPEGLLARYLRLADLLLEFGPNLGMPHTRAMSKGLFELRLKSKEGIARVFYCTVVTERIIMLHVFTKKSQKTPQKELEVARQRLKEVMRILIIHLINSAVAGATTPDEVFRLLIRIRKSFFSLNSLEPQAGL